MAQKETAEVGPAAVERPSVGRIVWVRRQGHGEHPAIVTGVSADGINVHVFHDGAPAGHKENVAFSDAGDEADLPVTSKHDYFWRWPVRS